MTISERILKLKQDTNLITSNPILELINIPVLKSFEERSESDNSFKRKLSEIDNLLNDMSYVYDKKYQDIFNAYNELVIYDLLSKKVTTEIIKEEKGIKTPDYKISTGENLYLYSDLKTLHFVNGNLNYIDIQEQGYRSKVKLDKQIKNAKGGVYFGEPVVVSPFKKENNTNHYNLNVIIEEVIAKAINNYKPEQVNYQSKKGIYLVDTTHLLIPGELEQGLPIFNGKLYGELNSGILWNVAFGEINDPTYNWIEFEGCPNIGERLRKNGLLKEVGLESMRAVAFICGNEERKKIIGFHRREESDEFLLEILYAMCDFVNDETNSRYFNAKVYD